MSRTTLGRILGLFTAVAGILVMLAGSDWPPPRGFAAVIAVAAGAGVVTALVVPPLLGLRDRAGTGRAVAVALAAGAGLGAVVGLGFAAAGTGEPSIPPPGARQIAVFVGVLAVAGMLAAGLLATVAFAGDRVRRAGPTQAGE